MDGSLTQSVALLAVVGLGLSAGALLTEGAVLVPFWQSLDPEEFLHWYQRNAALLLRFFAPLEIAPALLAVLATVSFFYDGRPGSGMSALSSLLALGVLLAFPLYFRAANASFADATIGLERVTTELRRWAAWHWARTFVAMAAFVAGLSALVGLG